MIVAKIKEIELHYSAEDVLTYRQVTDIQKEITSINVDLHYSAICLQSLDAAAKVMGERILQNDELALGKGYIEFVLAYDDVDERGMFNHHLDVKTSNYYRV